MRRNHTNRDVTEGTRAAALIAGATLVVAGLAGPAAGQVASALLQEDAPVPGKPGLTVGSISQAAVNGVGGYAFLMNSSGEKGTLSHVFGSVTGEAPAVLRTEGIFGDLEQTSFEGFFGFADNGDAGYSPSCTDLDTGETGLDCAFIGDVAALVEGELIATIDGQFSTFNSRVGATRDGRPYWIGGYTDEKGGSTQNRALFLGTELTPLLQGGDAVGGVAEPIEVGGSLDFDVRLSEMGTSYLLPVNLDATPGNDTIIVLGGDALTAGGSVVREGEPIPTSVGGMLGENWDNFDFMGITEAGDVFFTGDSDADSAVDEFVFQNGSIVLREGTVVDAPGGGTVTIDGAIEGGYQNAGGDWAVIWDVEDDGGTNVEALLVNGTLILTEGMAVDWDGDGVIDEDAIVDGFTGISTLALSDRDGDGVVRAYFTADVSVGGADELEGAFCLAIDLDGAPDCPEDLVGDDGAVTTEDLLALLAAWGTDGAGSDLAEPFDVVDTSDLLALLAAWGPCP